MPLTLNRFRFQQWSRCKSPLKHAFYLRLSRGASAGSKKRQNKWDTMQNSPPPLSPSQSSCRKHHFRNRQNQHCNLEASKWKVQEPMGDISECFIYSRSRHKWFPRVTWGPQSFDSKGGSWWGIWLVSQNFWLHMKWTIRLSSWGSPVSCYLPHPNVCAAASTPFVYFFSQRAAIYLCQISSLLECVSILDWCSCMLPVFVSSVLILLCLSLFADILLVGSLFLDLFGL